MFNTCVFSWLAIYGHPNHKPDKQISPLKNLLYQLFLDTSSKLDEI